MWRIGANSLHIDTTIDAVLWNDNLNRRIIGQRIARTKRQIIPCDLYWCLAFGKRGLFGNNWNKISALVELGKEVQARLSVIKCAAIAKSSSIDRLDGLI